MSESGKRFSIRQDNRGASLLLVLAVFVVMLVVVMNLLMLVSAGNRTTVQEYEAEQTEMYLASIYEVLNSRMVAGTFSGAFVADKTTNITVSGFQDGEGNAIPVEIKVSLVKTVADVEYYITYQGEQYCIKAKYACRKKDGKINITLRSCEELTQL